MNTLNYSAFRGILTPCTDTQSNASTPRSSISLTSETQNPQELSEQLSLRSSSSTPSNSDVLEEEQLPMPINHIHIPPSIGIPCIENGQNMSFMVGLHAPFTPDGNVIFQRCARFVSMKNTFPLTLNKNEIPTTFLESNIDPNTMVVHLQHMAKIRDRMPLVQMALEYYMGDLSNISQEVLEIMQGLDCLWGPMQFSENKPPLVMLTACWYCFTFFEIQQLVNYLTAKLVYFQITKKTSVEAVWESAEFKPYKCLKCNAPKGIIPSTFAIYVRRLKTTLCDVFCKWTPKP
jgi:hypothetical protein